MSKKLQKAANEKDQKSILKYAKVTEEECRKEGEGQHNTTDTTVLASAERGIELKDATSTPKRKRYKEAQHTTVNTANRRNLST